MATILRHAHGKAARSSKLRKISNEDARAIVNIAKTLKSSSSSAEPVKLSSGKSISIRSVEKVRSEDLCCSEP